MKTIMLACAAGMSTSMLVAKMQEAAREQGIEADIFAVSVDEVDSRVKDQTIDVILLGPQVRYQEKSFKDKYEPQGIPVAVIDMMQYGMMQGDKVLESSRKLLEEQGK